MVHNNSSDIAIYGEMWLSMKSYIQSKERLDAASQFIGFLVDNGLCDVDVDIDELVGICNILDRAVTIYKREHSSDEEDEDEDEYEDSGY